MIEEYPFATVTTINEDLARSKGVYPMSAVYLFRGSVPFMIFEDRDHPKENAFLAKETADKLNASAQEWFDHVKWWQ